MHWFPTNRNRVNGHHWNAMKNVEQLRDFFGKMILNAVKYRNDSRYFIDLQYHKDGYCCYTE